MTMRVRCAGLPLAVYREVAAHLEQVDGVTTALVPQQATTFDYGQSQIDHLQLTWGQTATVGAQQQVDRILAYYGDRYGAWETLD